MLGFEDAAHAEINPAAARLLISRLSCSLVGESERIAITPGTLVHQVYGKEQVVETYRCNYSLNPEYQAQISQGKLRVVGINGEGAVRVVELAGHRYFVGSLFLPQMRSSAEKPHPIIKGYLKAALRFSSIRQRAAAKKAV